MSIIIKKQFVCSFILCFFGMLFDGCTKGENYKTNHNSINVNEYPDVCEVINNVDFYNGKRLKVKGRIKGYHDVILYNEACWGGKNFFELDFSMDVREKLATMSDKDNTDFRGYIYIIGDLEKESGVVKNAEQYEPAKSKLDYITVSRISNIKMDGYEPEEIEENR